MNMKSYYNIKIQICKIISYEITDYKQCKNPKNEYIKIIAYDFNLLYV